MMKKDEGNDKKTSPPRGRIMQVVEVEEEDASKQKIDIPMPSEIVKGKELSTVPASGVSASDITTDIDSADKEKPDIASSFGPPPEEEQERSEITPHTVKENREEIPPLKTEEKRDIVSELFETKDKKVQYPDISIDRKPSRFGFFMWAFILIAIVGLIGGGLLYWKQKSSTPEQVESLIPTLTPTFAPTETETPITTPSGKLTPTKSSTPSATPKKTGLSIQVLNGSGKTGVASVMKKFLEEKGYNVVGTGNAPNFDYEKTEIIIKAEKTSSLDKLKTDLSSGYTVGSTSATLNPSAAYDAQVIIGKE